MSAFIVISVKDSLNWIVDGIKDCRPHNPEVVTYYTLVSIAVCLVSALSCYWSYMLDDKMGIATVAFGVFAILFNPIIPVYLHDKEVWSIIDIITAILLGIRYLSLKKG